MSRAKEFFREFFVTTGTHFDLWQYIEIALDIFSQMDI
jgi:hypothetical protein